MSQPKPHIRVHLTNVAAAGPTEVVKSLLPALENCGEVVIDEIYLPDRGSLADYRRVTPGRVPSRHRRLLPNVLSRVMECTVLARQFNQPTPILVLGDIPLACNSPQVVFIQRAHMAREVPSASVKEAIKNGIARQLFRLNSPRVSKFIVQTEVMRALMESSYPGIKGRTVVIGQPPPSWLLDSGLRRRSRVVPTATGLNLLYPAADHAHKNHAILGHIHDADTGTWPVDQLTLTIPTTAHPNRNVRWIKCVGFLSPPDLLQRYGETDAIVLLSRTESYGLPLVEAMHVGLPIVAPDLPYARTLCGDGAIYFDVDSIESLRTALIELQQRLMRGWWPDWTRYRAALPDDWSHVARAFLETLAPAHP